MGLTMAVTGNLIFGQLHTNSAIQSVNRVINVFPPHQQGQVRQLLSFTLQAIVSQCLVPKIGGRGRAMACEVLVPSMAIRNLIREEKIHQIYSAMQTGQGETGMQTLNQALIGYVKSGVISPEAAMEYSYMPEELMRMLQNLK